MLDKLDVLQQTALAALETLTDLSALDAWHSQHLGRKGELTQLLRSVGQLPREERPAAGRRADPRRGNSVRSGSSVPRRPPSEAA